VGGLSDWGEIQGKKNRKEKDLIIYVDNPSTKTQGQRRAEE
jgi:hypothetical protein